MFCDYRKRFARLAQACFLPGSQMGRDAKAAGLDPSDIVKALTGVVLERGRGDGQRVRVRKNPSRTSSTTAAIPRGRAEE